MRASTRLPEDPTAAHAARSFVAETLEIWGVGTYVLGKAVLITSELVTNAIVHARSPVALVITSHNGTLRIDINDDSEQQPALGVSHDELGGRRGLQIVEALADRWGTNPGGHGKTVWFELASVHDEHSSADEDPSPSGHS